MKIVRAREVEELTGQVPESPGSLLPHWFEEPVNGDRLDAGVVTMSAHGATPPHIHIGGQVMIVTSGRGFVETEDERVEVGVGDVVVAAPGELHTHGALDGPFTHLNVTTGGYRFPEP